MDTSDRHDPDQFLKAAKDAVIDMGNVIPATAVTLFTNDLYIVWFSKTLKNWKALISTDVKPGLYFEVTHNGDKNETYVDAYTKHKNHVITH